MTWCFAMFRLGERDGLWVLAELLQRSPDLTVVMMSAYGSEESAVEAMKRGAYDYISKPFRPDEVALVLRKAEERERLRRDNQRLRRQLGEGGGPPTRSSGSRRPWTR